MYAQCLSSRTKTKNAPIHTTSLNHAAKDDGKYTEDEKETEMVNAMQPERSGGVCSASNIKRCTAYDEQNRMKVWTNHKITQRRDSISEWKIVATLDILQFYSSTR